MNDQEKLAAIHRLLDEAYDHYFKHSDGYCKSGEGHITVYYGNYWERGEKGVHVTGLEIYSYVLGPFRRHYFDNLDQALDVVKQWHRREMARDYADPHNVDRDLPKEPCLYTAIEAEREARRGREWEELSEYMAQFETEQHQE